MRIVDSKARIALVTLLTSTAYLLAAWQAAPTVTHWYQERLAQQLADRIADSEDNAAKGVLRQLANLGATGLRPLVSVASSQCGDVAKQARQIVECKMTSWQLQAQQDPDFGIADLLSTLAVALGEYVDEFDPAGQRWAEHLVLEMVQSSEALPAGEAAKLLGACSRALAAIPARGPRMRTVAPGMQEHLLSDERALKTPKMPLGALAVPSERAQEVAMNTPREATAATNRSFDSRSSADVEIVFAEPVVSNGLRQSGRSGWPPDWAARQEPGASSLRLGQPPSNNGSNRRPPASEPNRVIDVPTPQDMKRRQKKLSSVPTKVLIKRLATADFYEAGTIRTVLRQRGFADAELALAPQLTSENAADRIQLIDRLAVLPASTARRWLRRLLEDKSAEVRLKALSALATTSDPELFDLARDLAVEDEDKRVSDLASRIMRQVR